MPFPILALLSLAITAPGPTGGPVDGRPRWPDERESGIFVCHADFDLTEFGGLMGQIGQLEQDVRGALGVPQPREQLHVFLFAQRATYVAYLARYFPSVPRRPAVFIKGHGPGMVFAVRSRQLGEDLRHEVTHALLHASLPFVPLWLDEGLAEYFEVPAGDRAGRQEYFGGMRLDMVRHAAGSLEQLEQLDDVARMGTAEYRHAWAWVHFMLHGPPAARSALSSYLRDLESGLPAEAVVPLSRRLRGALPNLDQEFADHFGLRSRN